CRFVERFTGRQHPADRHVPERRVNVLGRSPLVDEQVAAGVEDQDVGAAMRQVAVAHLAPRRCPDDGAAVVDDVNQFVGGGLRQGPLRNESDCWYFAVEPETPPPAPPQSGDGSKKLLPASQSLIPA